MHMKRTLVIVAVEAERAALGAACLASPAVRVVVAGIVVKLAFGIAIWVVVVVGALWS